MPAVLTTGPIMLRRTRRLAAAVTIASTHFSYLRPGFRLSPLIVPSVFLLYGCVCQLGIKENNDDDDDDDLQSKYCENVILSISSEYQ